VALATATRAHVAANNEFPFSDLASTLYLADKQSAELLVLPASDAAKQLTELSVAAATAFLTYAADHVVDPGPGSTNCPPNTTFKINEGCVDDANMAACPYDLPSCDDDADCASGYVCNAESECCMVELI
jgi:hypothetical protein